MKKFISILLVLVIALSFYIPTQGVMIASNIWGDFNADGYVDDVDVMLLTRYLANWDLEDPVDVTAVDFDEDDDVGDIELMTLTRYLANWDLDTQIGEFIKTIMLEGVKISKYVIVLAENCSVTELNAANYIRDYIKELTSVNLNIVYDTAEEQEYEILIGKTNRAFSQEFNENEVGGFEFALTADEGKVMIYGFDFLIAGGAYYFTDNLIDNNKFAEIDIPDAGLYLSPTPEEANNFILYIGDGMGQNHIKFLDHYIPPAGKPAKRYDYFMARYLPNQGAATTYSANNAITDSAAGGTALATGYKTNNYYVGLDPDGNAIMNLSELAISKGMKTAVLTTDAMYGATPGAFSAHVSHRNEWREIYKQQQASGIDIIKGSIKENTLNVTMKETLETLESGENGFFMMYEEAHVDKSSHDNNFDTLMEALERGNMALNIIMEYIMYHPDTMLIITADHETGGLFFDEENDFTPYWTAGDHTAADVPVIAYGFGTEIFNNTTVNNIDIPKFIAAQMGEENFGQADIETPAA